MMERNNKSQDQCMHCDSTNIYKYNLKEVFYAFEYTVECFNCGKNSTEVYAVKYLYTEED